MHPGRGNSRYKDPEKEVCVETGETAGKLVQKVRKEVGREVRGKKVGEGGHII